MQEVSLHQLLRYWHVEERKVENNKLVVFIVVSLLGVNKLSNGGM